MQNNQKYLKSPINLSISEAYDRIMFELDDMNLKPKKISLDSLDLELCITSNSSYVDLGFHSNLIKFGNELDSLFNLPERFSVEAKKYQGREHMFGGGVARNFNFRDENNNSLTIWTTFYKKDTFDLFNWYLKGHEQFHVGKRLGYQDVLIEKILTTFKSCETDLSQLDEEFLATISGLTTIVIKEFNINDIFDFFLTYKMYKQRNLDIIKNILKVKI